MAVEATWSRLSRAERRTASMIEKLMLAKKGREAAKG
jgi:hypothetical protein